MHWQVTLDAGNGQRMEVGTLLRERRIKEEGALSAAKKESRHVLWRKKNEALEGELGPNPIAAMEKLRLDDICLVAMSRSWVAPAIIVTPNRTKKNGLRPIGSLAAGDIETVGLELLQSAGDQPWIRWKDELLRAPLRILERLPLESYVKQKKADGTMNVLLSASAERLRKEYIRKMPALFRKLEKM